MPGIIEELEIDYSAAISGAEEFAGTLDTALQTSVDNFQTNLASALSDISSSIPPIDLTVDTPDLSGTADQINQVSDAASNASENTKGFSGDLKGLEGVALLATGEVGGMRTVVQGFGASAIPAVAGSLALAGGIGAIAQAGVEGTAAQQRYNTILGQFAKQLETIKVGDLDTSTKSLALSLGTVPSKLQNTTANLFQLGTNAGFSGKQTAGVTQEIIALAARAVALKPSLGDVADVADAMGLRLGRGGIRVQQYGVQLTSAQINAEALRETHKNLTAELTPYEKTVAAVNLATAQYGGTLKKTIDEGSKNALIQQRSLKATVQDMIETLGKPLVAPLFDLMRAGVPIAESLGRVLAELGTSVLPLLATAAEIAGPALNIIADVLQALQPLIQPLVVAWGAYLAITKLIPPVLALMTTGLLDTAAAAPIAGDAILALAITTDEAGTAIEGASGPIGLIIGAATLAAGAIGLFGGSESKATVDTTGFASALERANGALDETATKAAAKALQSAGALHNLADAGIRVDDAIKLVAQTNGGKILEDIAANIASLGQQANTGSAGVRALQEQNDQLIAKLRATKPALADMVDALIRQHDLTPQLARALAELADAYTGAGKSAKDLNTTTGDSATQFANAKQAADDYKTALENLDAGQTGLFDSQTKSAAAAQDLFQKFLAAKGSIDPATQAGRDYRDALVASVGAARSQAEALRLTGVNAQTAAKPLTDLATQIATLGHNSGETPGQIAQLLASVGLISPGTAGAITNAFQLGQAIAGIGPAAAGVAPAVASAAPAVEGAVAGLSGVIDAGFFKFRIQTHAHGVAAGEGLGTGVGEGGKASVPGSVAQVGNTLSLAAGKSLLGVALNAGEGVGSVLAQGIAIGISSHTSTVTTAAVTIVNAAAAAAKAAAKSSSPSLVFAEIGQDLSAGLAVGIRAGTPLVVKESTTVIQQAAAPATTVNNNISGGGGVSGPLIGQMILQGVDAQKQAHNVIREANIARANAGA